MFLPTSRGFKSSPSLGFILILLIGRTLISFDSEGSSNSGLEKRASRPADLSSLANNSGKGSAIPADPQGQATEARAAEAYAKLPMSFEANQGQINSQVKFLSRGAGYSLFLSPAETVISLSKSSTPNDIYKPFASQRRAPNRRSAIVTSLVRMKLLNANPAAEIEGLDQLPGKSNYLIGNDPEKWKTNIPNYARIKQADVYPGVDMIYYGDQQQLEYDFVVAPGASPAVIQLGFEGIRSMRLDRDGDLLLRSGTGEIRQHKPFIYQETNGIKQSIEGRYLLKGGHQVGFEIGNYDQNQPLVIDPILVYSSYLGGTHGDLGHAIAVDEAGNAYVAGETSSVDFPTQNPFQSQINGPTDAFITKINAAGSAIVYSTYLGGSSASDRAYAIAVDGLGAASITGATGSTDFPTRNPIQSQLTIQFIGGADAFVTKLDASGSGLIFSTYLGGLNFDAGFGITYDSAGNVYVTGQGQFPATAQSFQPTSKDGLDAFIVKLNPVGTQVLYSTSLGGRTADAGLAIAVDSSQNAFITGFTESVDFPTRNALQPALRGMSDAFVAKISTVPTPFALPLESFDGENGGLTARPYSNFANWNVTSGQVNLEPNPLSTTTGLIVNFDGYPPHGASIETKSALALKPITYRLRFDLCLRNNASTFTVRLGNVFSETFTLNSLGTSTGEFASVVRDIQVPALTSAKLSFEHSGDIGAGVWLDNVSVFERPASEYVTFLGGGGDENRLVGPLTGGIKVDAAGNACVTGWTDSSDFPTANPIQFALGGARDAFISKLNPAGSALIYSTFYGGAADDFGNDLGIDSEGNVFVVGNTKSSNFPTVNAIQSVFGGETQFYGDAFAMKLSANGSDVIYSTYLGGNGRDMAESVAIDSTGTAALITGMSAPGAFPTVNPFQSRPAATFVAKIFDSSRLSVVATTPAKGGNVGEVSVAILGGRFQTGATVKLRAANQPDIVGANVAVVNSSRITATFDLRGASLGPRDVLVTLPDGSTATLVNGFSIEQGGGPQIWVDMVGPRVIRTGREQTFYLTYGNRGNVDSSNTSLFVSFPKSLTWKLDPNVLSFGKYETASDITLAINIGNISAGSSSGIPIQMTNPSAGSQFQMKAWWGDSPALMPGASNANPDSHSNPASFKNLKQNPALPSLDCIGVNQQTCPNPNSPGATCDAHCIECFRDKGVRYLVGFQTFKYQLPPVHLEHFLCNSNQPINWGSQSVAATIIKSNSFFIAEHAQNMTFWQPKIISEARVLGIGVSRPIDLQGTTLSSVSFYPPWIEHRFENLVGFFVQRNEAEIALSFGHMDRIDDSLQGTVFRQRDSIGGCETIGFAGEITYQMNDEYSFPINGGREYDYEGGYLQACNEAKPFSTSLVVEMPFNYFESDCAPPPPCTGCTTTTINVNSVNSFDPNEKIGADGVGSAQFISGEEALRYVIDFENKATATAPAQEVIVTDQLDLSKFDVNTFSFGPITIGSQSVLPTQGVTQFTADVDMLLPSHLLVRIDARLDKNTGQLMWSFTSVDPNTGQLPSDPTAGFLPPGVGGSVLFTAMTKGALATATVVKNKATIVFDANSPLVTPEWSNTIDNSRPVSHVLALPATLNSASFNVQWSGTDTGSGIGDYTIYVSDNGGPFTPWLTQTTATQTTFASTANHIYSFFSTARDLTGNTEALKTTAEATTRIVAVANIAGKVTDPYGNGVADVKMTLTGGRAAAAQTDETGASTFADLPNGSYTITPSKTNYSFSPASKIFGSLSANQTADFIARVTSGAPILISEETSTRALALDSVLWLREPFQVNSPVPWGVDRRTRVMLFVMNFDFQPGEDISIFRADAEDASHRLYPLNVEYVGRAPGSFWLNSVVIRLNDEMGDLGDVLVRVNVRGVTSNRVRLGVGHKGGGLPDDPGSVPTPGRRP